MTPTGFPIDALHATVLNPGAPELFTGAIFDLDGTLLDSMPCWADLGENYLRRRGCTPKPDIQYHFKRMTVEESAAFMKRDYDLPEPPEEIFDGIMGAIKDDYFHTIPLKPGVAEALDAFAAAGVAMCVATATDRRCAEAALSRLGVLDRFSALFTCTEVGCSKVRPDIFLLARQHLGTPTGRTLVFEDSLHAIESATGAGFPTVAVHEPASAFELDGIRATAHLYLNAFTDVSAI